MEKRGSSPRRGSMIGEYVLIFLVGMVVGHLLMRGWMSR